MYGRTSTHHGCRLTGNDHRQSARAAAMDEGAWRSRLRYFRELRCFHRNGFSSKQIATTHIQSKVLLYNVLCIKSKGPPPPHHFCCTCFFMSHFLVPQRPVCGAKKGCLPCKASGGDVLTLRGGPSSVGSVE